MLRNKIFTPRVYFFFCTTHTSSKGSERESEIALQNHYFCNNSVACIYTCYCIHTRSHTHTHPSARACMHMYITYAVQGNEMLPLVILFIQRSTIGQSVFASFHKMVAGYCVNFFLRCMLCYFFTRRNYPTRLETRTKEFNWIASRRVSHKTHHIFCYGEAKATLCHVNIFFMFSAAQADYVYA